MKEKADEFLKLKSKFLTRALLWELKGVNKPVKMPIWFLRSLEDSQGRLKKLLGK